MMFLVLRPTDTLAFEPRRVHACRVPLPLSTQWSPPPRWQV